ncbi:PDR/VanB family oxidoreductase [Saccharopolyspora mangrovi]|uniref:PDR/VanB family oxidoreductase n=1 Tax=Saccharopolyspora mangrovi TaxID=3082379 RepID=A0ABU6AJK6_9PSEU|nr:PDR/VanB family oxidoreductase [Saccharopolyspora sp. S2-29]MEB3371688.1 PDR/VanB family oxidoreductase [Saccharopolyspora sp. S2-29]
MDRVRVTRKQQVAEDVVALRLEHPRGQRLPDWTPGAHIDLVLPNGVTRQYSLCGDRWDAHSYRIAVLREPDGRGGSVQVHDELIEGAEVSIGGPRNNFSLVPSPAHLFIAGGIGITPILPMLAAAERLGSRWRLLYGGRRRASMAFLDELTDRRVVVAPQDETGLLDLPDPGADCAVYCCGPEPLLEAAERRYGPGLRTERFAAKSAGAVDDRPFRVELARSGSSVTVGPDVSVLEAVRGAGASVLSSCTQGLCGTCETAVLAGEPEHRDSILDDSERERGDCMFPCVSRARTDRLVLDL